MIKLPKEAVGAQLVPLYVKRWRTIIKVPAGIKDEIAAHLTPSPLPGEEIGRRKLAAIFERAPWLLQEDRAVHLPVAGMEKDHQLTWSELALLSRQPAPGWDEAIKIANASLSLAASITDPVARNNFRKIIAALTRPATDADRIGILD